MLGYFVNEIIECDIANEKPAQFKKNIIRIVDKIRYPLIQTMMIAERSTFFINSELKRKPHENTACVFLTWTSLKM